jgi:Rhodopirellula transposase DDE domain
VAAIAATATGTGLRVRAELDTGSYPPGATISDEQMAALPLRRHDWHGDWNYTLYPRPPAAAPPPQPLPSRGERPGWAHPALTGMPTADWDQLTRALALPYQAQREAEMHIARGGPQPAGGPVATRKRSPSPRKPWSPSCGSAWQYPGPSWPSCSVSPPAPSPQPNGRSRRCSNERATRSNPPPPGSPHWPTSPHTHQPKASRSRRKPNQRVNNRQTLNVISRGRLRYLTATHGQPLGQVSAVNRAYTSLCKHGPIDLRICSGDASRLGKRWRFGGLPPGARTVSGYCRPILPGTPRLGAVA